MWDIGANVGLFSKAAAYRAGPKGKVLAIAADNDAVALLDRTRRMHSVKHAPMTILPVALSDSTGFIQFAISKPARSTNSIEGLGTAQTGSVAETLTARSLTLDGLLGYFPPPDMIKIDVEAAEAIVLMGGSRVLREARPTIHCEVASEASSEVTRLFRSHAYKLYDAPDVARRMATEIEEATSNTVAIPREKVAEELGCR